jgi:hypothetical protein
LTLPSLGRIEESLMPNGVHTAKRISDAKRQQIVLALSAGEPKYKIAQRVHSNHHLVGLVLEQEWAEIANRKQILAAQAEKLAMRAGEQIAEALDKKTIPIGSLIPVYGVSIDKAIALRSDGLQRIELNINQSNNGPSLFDRINDLARQINEKTAHATVIDVNTQPNAAPNQTEDVIPSLAPSLSPTAHTTPLALSDTDSDTGRGNHTDSASQTRPSDGLDQAK